MPKTKYKKRSDGRYVKNITVGIKEDGKPDRRSIYGRTIQELEFNISKFEEEFRKHGAPSREKYTLAEWAQQYYYAYCNNLDEPDAGYADWRLIKNYILPWPQSAIDIRKIKLLDLQQFMLTQGATRTAQMLRALLVRMYDAAIENAVASVNIARKLPPVNYSAPPTRTLTELEEIAILQADFTPQERAFVYSILFAGLRRGEVLALKKSGNEQAIDLPRKLLTVNKNIQFPKIQNKGILKYMPKTDAGFRVNPIIAPLHSALQECAGLENGSDFLLVNQLGEFHSRTSYRRLWEQIVRKMNAAVGTIQEPEPIKGLRSHILRHTFCTYLAVIRLPPSTAQQLMGHSDISMTLKVYTHLPLVNRYVHSPIFEYYKEFLTILQGQSRPISIKGKTLRGPSKLSIL